MFHTAAPPSPQASDSDAPAAATFTPVARRLVTSFSLLPAVIHKGVWYVPATSSWSKRGRMLAKAKFVWSLPDVMQKYYEATIICRRSKQRQWDFIKSQQFGCKQGQGHVCLWFVGTVSLCDVNHCVAFEQRKVLFIYLAQTVLERAPQFSVSQLALFKGFDGALKKERDPTNTNILLSNEEV